VLLNTSSYRRCKKAKRIPLTVATTAAHLCVFREKMVEADSKLLDVGRQKRAAVICDKLHEMFAQWRT